MIFFSICQNISYKNKNYRLMALELVYYKQSLNLIKVGVVIFSVHYLIAWVLGL